ncbi:hypothetical protein [Streptomyces sp. Ag109_G2-15]|uniref:hypothetical protein n=1 Tax=Streptomyces sp. Ag109_G2-15 TaxID=1938850 RepID=UPI000BC441BD|nr:hypothetical protein [Streptomyces sp. Ag109_G2-15]SOE07429.1 hypothetical protein SAMN06272765_8326 [Streptomyces sp. Ag109_G2-15]
MSGHSERGRQQEAQDFLDLLRAQARAEQGTTDRPPGARAAVRDLTERILRDSFNAEQGKDPRIRAQVEHEAARNLRSQDDVFAEMFAGMQDHIERTARDRIQGDGLDLAALRPLISHLRTGQLNAVSMRVPGRFGAHLVLVEDQMPLFASKLSKAVAWAVPHGPGDAEGMVGLQWSLPAAVERIETVPEVAERFTDIVVAYAVTGRVGNAGHHLLPPGLFNFAGMLRDSLEYFVVGHEYAHIISGHLDSAVRRRGVLPVEEAEVLAYSWRQEFDADLLGMVLSLNAGVEHDNRDLWVGFLGISLFFDALDVMDRAVALLQTGDEHARQLGSHPPSDLRKQCLRAFLPRMADADRVRMALELADIQGQIIRELWARTRPALLDLHRRGVPTAQTWRTIPKETGDPGAVPTAST